MLVTYTSMSNRTQSSSTMPSEQWSDTRFIGGTWVTREYLSRAWHHSPRVNGKLRLQSNVYTKVHKRLRTFTNAAHYLPSGVTAPFGHERALDSAMAESYSRLRGKLYKGSAALGLTLATYKQSREMIVNRYKSLDRSIEELYARANRRRDAGKQVSNLYLEYVFGWAPLLTDIVSACTTVIELAEQSGFVSATSRQQISSRNVYSVPILKTVSTCDGIVIVNRSSQYVVSNPNTWLLERAGLLNPAAIAWDAVPWSFVVNMFANTGALVGTITDFVGLSFPNGSTTTTFRTSQYHYRYENYPGGMYRASGGSHFSKSRVLGAVSPPPLVFKLPDSSWELAAIAASLVTQKLSKVTFR